MSIDKRIFYCWFGHNEMSELEKACIESWSRCCPDYEIVKISEDTPGFTMDKYASDAYEHGNWSFVSDYARLWTLERQSGIYLDTDIKLLKPLDDLLKYDAFVGMSGVGFYNSVPIARGQAFPTIFKEAKEQLVDGKCLNTLMNEIVYKHYDVYGAPFHCFDNIAFLGNKMFVTGGYTAQESSTYGIHYCNGSWLDKWQGSYDKASTFIKFQIYQDHIRDTNAEKKFFGTVVENDEIRFNSILTPVTKDKIFYGNFFYNPRVASVIGNTFNIRRTNVESCNYIEHQAFEGITLHLMDKVKKKRMTK